MWVQISFLGLSDWLDFDGEKLLELRVCRNSCDMVFNFLTAVDLLTVSYHTALGCQRQYPRGCLRTLGNIQNSYLRPDESALQHPPKQATQEVHDLAPSCQIQPSPNSQHPK